MKIVKYPNPVLNKVCKPVDNINKDILSLAGEMLVTMADAGGIGLAAPQVDKEISMFIIDTRNVEDGGILEVFINPEIKGSRGINSIAEGCLSFPKDKTVRVQRAAEIDIEYTNLHKKRITKTLKGITAICAMHENDHLLGITFNKYEQ